jgi:hypothetical protein
MGIAVAHPLPCEQLGCTATLPLPCVYFFAVRQQVFSLFFFLFYFI